jgi:ABC-type nitrate/sulfonate/bicarbonate transport system substrate-binding protein
MKKILIFMMLSLFAFSKDVTVVLDWTPNTNHMGLYVAQELGYFKAEGLNVKILQPQGGTAEQLVATGKADFGISYQEAVTFARIQNLPIISIAAIIQHNTSGFASLKTKNIKSPKNWEGKKYGGWGSPVEVATIKALMKKDGGDFNKVKILTTGSADFFQTSKSNVDFAWVYEGWTNIEAKLKGFQIDYIPLTKYDKNLDYYTPVIITNEKIAIKDKDLAKKFMKATRKGYEYAISNPEKAAAILSKHAPELDKKLVLESSKFLSKKYRAEAPIWGQQKESVWVNYQNWLYTNKLITKKTDMKKAFTNEFIGK